MMDMEVSGIDDIKRLLDDVAPKKTNNILKATIRGVASVGVKKIKEKLLPHKKTGNLAKSLKIKVKRAPIDEPEFDIIFESGKNKKNDGFYWRFLENGTKSAPKELLFVRKTKVELDAEMEQLLKEQFVKKFEAAIRKEIKASVIK